MHSDRASYYKFALRKKKTIPDNVFVLARELWRRSGPYDYLYYIAVVGGSGDGGGVQGLPVTFHYGSFAQIIRSCRHGHYTPKMLLLSIFPHSSFLHVYCRDFDVRCSATHFLPISIVTNISATRRGVFRFSLSVVLPTVVQIHHLPLLRNDRFSTPHAQRYTHIGRSVVLSIEYFRIFFV